MERTEPSLVPQWLKNSTSSTGITSPSNSDESSTPTFSRKNSYVISNGNNSGRSSGFERTSSSVSRWGSGGINSGNFRSDSSSGKNQRDRHRYKATNGSHDQDKSFLEDSWRQEISDSEGSVSRLGRDPLRRSNSVLPGKHVDAWTRKGAADSSNAGVKSYDGALPKVKLPNGGNKAVFERDFPSLRAEERAVFPDVGRVQSRGLSPAIQSLQISPSASLGEKWTSALAEVPILVGTNGVNLSSATSAVSSSPSAGVSASTGLNMAEAVTYGPLRAATTPQLSVEAQRREELAIKQSRQLIPVTPSIPKVLAPNTSDKQRIKVGQMQPSSSAPISHTPRGLPGRGDSSTPSNQVKFHVLKPGKEKNGASFYSKDSSNLTSPNRVGSVLPAPSSAAAANGVNHVDSKPVSAIAEKRPTIQAQSRNEFFKLMRKKSMENTSGADSDASVRGNAISPSDMNALLPTGDMTGIDASPEKQAGIATNGGTHHGCSDPTVSDEEEAAFLRSLGWEENEEEGGLTEEEISAFHTNLTKYIESNPPLRILQGTELKFMLPLDSSPKGNSSDG